MVNRSRLEWYGPRVSASVRTGSRGGVAETIQACASRAAADWPRDTGLSAESITVVQPPMPTPTGVVGSWGAEPLPPSSAYSSSSRARVFFTEVGVRGRPGVGILRRTADSEYAELTPRIRRNMP